MDAILMKALQLVAALSLLILLHEFGHYIFARIFGIKVEKFYLFFNPWFSLMRYNPAKGRLEIGTWTDKEAKERCLLNLRVGRDREAEGAKISGWRQTIYGIGWLPLGGYCKIAGMVDESMDTEQMAKEPQEWEFRSKPAWQRLLVMLGGVLFNFLTAIVIYIGVTFSYGERLIRYRDAYAGMDFTPTAIQAGFRPGDIPLMADGREVEADEPDAPLQLASAREVTVLRNGTDTVRISLPKDFLLDINDAGGFFAYRLPVFVESAVKGEPAAKAGLRKGDRIIAVGDSLTPSYTELITALQAYADKATTVTVVRDGNEITRPIRPTADGKLGFNLTRLDEVYPVVVKSHSLFSSVPLGIDRGWTSLANYASSLKYVVTPRGAKSLGGFGTLGSLFPERWNWYTFWELTAFLSIALAVMNVLPIPALDGGHVLFLLWEIVTRRPVPEKFLEYAQMTGMAFLLALLLYVNGNDIFRFLLK
ncbi:MAG: RIP metalloprotease RseP [Muribaculaceae bacterium]|nr:RIP metalloprotease RseP [Muribaculaceae bacterium]